jgi:hypothetical protein
MNLIQQFPDVSMQMRDKLRLKKTRKGNSGFQSRDHNDNAADLTVFYDNEFRKWHYKLGLIIVLAITGLYAVTFTISGIFQWLMINHN